MNIFPNWAVAISILIVIVFATVLLIRSKAVLPKITLHGIENIQANGPIIFAASQIRFDEQFALFKLPIKKLFVIDLSSLDGYFTENPSLQKKIIVIKTREGFRSLINSLKEARNLLNNNENIGIVTEWFQPNAKTVLPSFRYVQALLKGTKAVVVPIYLEQPKGSNYTIKKKKVFNRNILTNQTHWHLFAGTSFKTLDETRQIKSSIQNLSVVAAKIIQQDLPLVHLGFAYQALREPNRPCFPDNTSPKLDLSYGKTLVAVCCLSDQLRSELKNENHIGIWLPNSMGSALTNIALANLGKVSVNLNYSASAEILGYCIEKAEVKTVITAKKFTSKINFPLNSGIRLIYLEDIMPKIKARQKAFTFIASKILPANIFINYILKAHQPNPNDTMSIIFSSGSTGNPKGVMLTYQNITSNCWSTIKGADVDYTDCLLGALPFFHSFGYTVSMWTPIQVGASVVYQPDPRQAREIGAACKNYKCSVYLSTATFLRFCLKKSEPDDFKSLRLLICGAEKLPATLAVDFESRFGVLPLEGYGCTELSPVVSISKCDVDIPGGTILGNLQGSIGQIIPGVDIKIVDPDSLDPISTNLEGMVLATGLNVMKGYLNDSQKSSNSIKNGWYITGDMGKLNSESYVTLTGRLNRFAKIGGEMVPLERIEDDLHALLETSERVCAVTCVPDITRGERIIVLYLPELLNSFGVDPKVWIKKLSAKGLPNLWVPSEKDFHPVKEIGTLGSGKLDLASLKSTALSLFSAKN